jgi:hypothetical protein
LGDFGELAFVGFDVVAYEAVWAFCVEEAHHVTGNGRGKSGDSVVTVHPHRSRLDVQPTLASAFTLDGAPTLGIMPAVGELVRCTDGRWMVRQPTHCPRGHRLTPGRTLVGHQPCGCAQRGGHITWAC